MEELGEKRDLLCSPDSSQLLSFINETEIPCAELLPLSVCHALLPPLCPATGSLPFSPIVEEMCDAARVSGTMNSATLDYCLFT